jgi:hypothetical protein
VDWVGHFHKILQASDGEPCGAGTAPGGMLSQADVARNYPEDRVGELVEFISY